MVEPVLLPLDDPLIDPVDDADDVIELVSVLDALVLTEEVALALAEDDPVVETVLVCVDEGDVTSQFSSEPDK